MIIVLIIQLVFVVIFVVIDVVLIRSVLFGAPYAPSTAASIDRMIALAKIQPGEAAVDLGSGDGRVVIALALAGAKVVGYETNWALVWWSRWRIRRAGVELTATIFHKSYWSEDLSRYAIVTLFGMTHIMGRLEQKLRHELRPGARVLANSFSFPHWQPTRTDSRVYCYEQTSLLH